MDSDISAALVELDKAQRALNQQLNKVNIKLKALAAARAILANGESERSTVKRRRGNRNWFPKTIHQLKIAGRAGLGSAILAERLGVGKNHAAGLLSKLKADGTATHDKVRQRWYIAGNEP